MINYTPKQRSTDLQDAIAQFLAKQEVTVGPTKGKRPESKAAAERREAYFAKRELEHTALVDAGR